MTTLLWLSIAVIVADAFGLWALLRHAARDDRQLQTPAGRAFAGVDRDITPAASTPAPAPPAEQETA